MGKIRTVGIGAVAAGAVAYAAKRLVGFRPRGRAPVDDVTLVRQVESELSRTENAPKGQISVNAANGVVQLRGQVEQPELIDELVQRARSVQGVRDVENLLHLPGEAAPMHQ
jgi:osmotically-inducible protein OsmY